MRFADTRLKLQIENLLKQAEEATTFIRKNLAQAELSNRGTWRTCSHRSVVCLKSLQSCESPQSMSGSGGHRLVAVHNLATRPLDGDTFCCVYIYRFERTCWEIHTGIYCTVHES